MAYVGKRVVRRDAVEKVTGRGRYLGDLAPGRGSASVLHGATVRSPIPHGRVLAIRVDGARGVAGVAAVVTAADITPPGSNLLPLVVNDYPLLADDRVRFVGQPVALVAAETVEAARAAAALVEVDYEPLPAVFDPLEALEPGAPKVHEPDNALQRNHILKGDPDRAFAECDVVVERTYSTGHQVHVYLETQGMLAEPDGHGGLVVRGSMQCPYYVLDAVVAATGLQRNQVQIEQTETGGGFGGKEDVPSLVAAHAALLCRATGRPVKIVYDREEDFATMSKRHPGWARVRYGARRSGEILACDVRYVINGGAYTTLSPIVLWRGTVHAAGAYEIPNVRIESVAAATNTVPCGAFRGFGQPQIAFAQESCIDELARELGLDPAELRRRNMLRPGRLTATGQRIDESCGLEQAFDRVLKSSGWAVRREALSKAGEIEGRRRGLGVAIGYYGVGLGAGGRHIDRAHASIQIEADGSVLVAVGNTEMGQGARSELAQIAADALGAPYEAIVVRPVDTSRVPDSGPTVASRTTIASGMAVLDAARGLRLRLDEVAARLLDGPPEASDGVYTSANGATLAFADLAAACHRERVLMQSVGQWRQDRTTFDFQGHGQGDAYEVYAFSATVAEVEVDVETGVAEVIDLWAAIDVGRAVNPDQVEAQIEGGVLQAMGYALTEELVLEEGRIRNGNLSGYIIPTAVDMPRIHPFIVEAAYAEGPFGAKGFGELPMIGTPPAIANAVAHALGARCRRLPMLPERLLALGADEEALP